MSTKKDKNKKSFNAKKPVSIMVSETKGEVYLTKKISKTAIKKSIKKIKSEIYQDVYVYQFDNGYVISITSTDNSKKPSYYRNMLLEKVMRILQS